MKKEIKTLNAPQAIGAYCQAVASNGFVFTSGQLGMDPKTNKLVNGIENQINQVMKNLEQVLLAAGSDLSQIVKTTILLADIEDFAIVNEVYAKYLENNFPARSAYQVANLPLQALVEIEAIAFVSDEK